jgi:hypothetical protein
MLLLTLRGTPTITPERARLQAERELFVRASVQRL